MANIQLAYTGDLFDCYQVTQSLPVWVSKAYGDSLPWVLFGYGCEASERGFETAGVSGLLLSDEDVSFLKDNAHDLTLEEAFSRALQKNEKVEITLPSSIGLVIKCHAVYGRLITFKKDQRFAVLYYRRFRELLKIIGIDYVDDSTPHLNLPSHLRRNQEVYSDGCDFIACPNFGNAPSVLCDHRRVPLRTLNRSN